MSSSPKVRDAAFYVLLALTAVAFIVEIQLIFLQAPVEKTMGIVQKIFYFHVPAAIGMYVAAIACFFGSAAYLYSPTDARDALGKAGAEAAVAFGVIVLVTGPLWAAKAWGRYWTWDPRLTTSMLSVLIYVSYVVLRAFAGDGQAEKKFSAALGVLGAAMLPIIHYSVQKWSGQHPVVVGEGGGGLDKAMYPAFFLGMISFTLLAVLLVWARARVEVARARLRQLEEEAIALSPEEST
jgi:heme exporter protein C